MAQFTASTHTAKFDNCAVAGARDDPAVVHGDGRIDQVASERPQTAPESGPRRLR